MSHSDVARRMADWRAQVSGIGHPFYRFLDPIYHPASRIPCMGIVEWVVEAWLDHDLESIQALIRELSAASVHETFFNVHQSDFGSSQELSVEERQAIIDEHKEGIGWVLDDVVMAGTPIERLYGLVTTSFPGDRAFVYLAAAVIVQAIGQFGGYDEQILTGYGRYLLAAGTIPWGFDLPDLAAAIARVNQIIRVRRQRSATWRKLDQLNPQLLAECGAATPSDVWEIVTRLEAVSVAARMHFFDVVSYSRWAKRPGALGYRTLYRTRVFGCYTPGTSEELVKAGLVLRDCHVELLDRWFRRNELREMLEESGASVKKYASLPELFKMAASSIPSKLVQSAIEGDFFQLPPEINEVGDKLIDLYECQARRLSAWCVGALIPALRLSA